MVMSACFGGKVLYLDHGPGLLYETHDCRDVNKVCFIRLPGDRVRVTSTMIPYHQHPLAGSELYCWLRMVGGHLPSVSSPI
jgi:hypothetical protein